MFAKTFTAQLNGLTPELISVETDVAKGRHSFNIIGLPDKAVDEARERINIAIKNLGQPPPAQGNRKVLISLAPANVNKFGSYFDLALAVSYLKAIKVISNLDDKKMFLGELSLNGNLKPIRGTVLLAQYAKAQGFTDIFVPAINAKEANLIEGLNVYALNNLKELLPSSSNSNQNKEKILQPIPKTKIKFNHNLKTDFENDLVDIKNQPEAKRALLVAVSGGHNIGLFGPPGTGKSLLAKAIPSIMPPLSFSEILEVTGIHSVAGFHPENLMVKPPFRSPHHTSSYVSLVGGGVYPKPGEITLAHRGILFLDEFPEFDQRVINSLRGPLEDHQIIVSRAKTTCIFPAHFMLVVALNPCPCGYKNSRLKNCICSLRQINQYARKISGPIIDRIDLWVKVSEVDHQELLTANRKEDSSAYFKNQIRQAREKAKVRFLNYPFSTNANVPLKYLKDLIKLKPEIEQILNQASKRLGLSARGYHRVIKIAQTIADLDQSAEILQPHILEALQYRSNFD